MLSDHLKDLASLGLQWQKVKERKKCNGLQDNDEDYVYVHIACTGYRKGERKMRSLDFSATGSLSLSLSRGQWFSMHLSWWHCFARTWPLQQRQALVKAYSSVLRSDERRRSKKKEKGKGGGTSSPAAGSNLLDWSNIWKLPMVVRGKAK